MLLNYISSELYKTKNRMYAKMFILISCICVVGAVALLKMTAVNGFNPNMNFVLQISPVFYVAFEFLILIVVDVVFSEEYKHHTLKNPVAFGIDRKSIYIGKVVVEIAYAIVVFVICMSVLILASYLILGVDTSTFGYDIKIFLLKSLTFLPLGIAALSFANFLAFTINSSNIFSLIYVGLVIGASKIISLLGYFNQNILKLNAFLPSTYMKMFQNEGIANELIVKSFGIGVLYLVIFAILGIVLFSRKEIK